MRARHFRGSTLLEAVRAAREVLGPDALIVAARRVGWDGWLRASRKARFEITALEAAAAPHSPPLDAEELDALRSLAVGARAFSATFEQAARLVEELSALRQAVEALRPDRTPGSTRANRATARIATSRSVPEGTFRRTDPTPRSVESWNRD